MFYEQIFAHVSPTSVFTHHKMYSKDVYRVNEEEGVPASRNLGGSGVVKFSKLSEVPDQRKPTGLQIGES